MDLGCRSCRFLPNIVIGMTVLVPVREVFMRFFLTRIETRVQCCTHFGQSNILHETIGIARAEQRRNHIGRRDPASRNHASHTIRDRVRFVISVLPGRSELAGATIQCLARIGASSIRRRTRRAAVAVLLRLGLDESDDPSRDQGDVRIAECLIQRWSVWRTRPCRTIGPNGPRSNDPTSIATNIDTWWQGAAPIA
jgi:hypothetical protein